MEVLLVRNASDSISMAAINAEINGKWLQVWNSPLQSVVLQVGMTNGSLNLEALEMKICFQMSSKNMIFSLIHGKQLTRISRTLQIPLKFKEILDYYQVQRPFKLTPEKFLSLADIKIIIKSLNKASCFVLKTRRFEEELGMPSRKLIQSPCPLLRGSGALIPSFRIKCCLLCRILQMKMMNR